MLPLVAPHFCSLPTPRLPGIRTGARVETRNTHKRALAHINSSKKKTTARWAPGGFWGSHKGKEGQGARTVFPMAAQAPPLQTRFPWEVNDLLERFKVHKLVLVVTAHRVASSRRAACACVVMATYLSSLGGSGRGSGEGEKKKCSSSALRLRARSPAEMNKQPRTCRAEHLVHLEQSAARTTPPLGTDAVINLSLQSATISSRNTRRLLAQ